MGLKTGGLESVAGALVLENGKVFPGTLWKSFAGDFMGEVVFNTSMVGYQEMLTDPSYTQQILCLTFPVIGVYGTEKSWNESLRVAARGLIVHDLYETGGEEYQRTNLMEFAQKSRLPILSNLDTRALVLELRSGGTKRGMIIEANGDIPAALAKLKAWTPKNHVQDVSISRMIRMLGNPSGSGKDQTHYRIAVYDFGVKSHIMEALKERGHEIIQVPYNTSESEISDLEVDALVFSNGPGDPMDLQELLPLYRKLAERYPTLGICLGHQILALAFGAKTYKLPYGHRGGNHPVRQIDNGKVFLTSQNHGYAVDLDSLKQTDFILTHESLNDGTVEGMKHTSLPIMSVQYHPEHHPGPKDSAFHFDDFLSTIHRGNR
jgi:carbamoyl-phosphate synthase small subunit